MRRSPVCSAIGLVGAILLCLGCAERKAPFEPTPSPVQSTPVPVPNLQDFRLSGFVVDTANRYVSSAEVAVIDGPRAGTVTTTNDEGQFSMPGTFTGNMTLTASKDGYQRETRSVLLPGHPPPQNPVSEYLVGFHLEPLGPRVNIAGEYVMTLTADTACTSLPDEARTRTYTAMIFPGGQSSFFFARLSDARFLPNVSCPGPYPPSCTYNQFGIGMAGDYAHIYGGIVERLSDGYLVSNVWAESSFGPTGITTPLKGFFLYCPSEPYLIDQGTWACPANAGVECGSHLTLVRR